MSQFSSSTLPCLYPGVSSLRLLKFKPALWRLDVAPALALYALAIAAARSADGSRWPVSPWVLVPLAALAHGFSLLAQAWSMSWRVAVTCDAVRAACSVRARAARAQQPSRLAPPTLRTSPTSLALFVACRSLAWKAPTWCS